MTILKTQKPVKRSTGLYLDENTIKRVTTIAARSAISVNEAYTQIIEKGLEAVEQGNN